ncbi:MAG: threonine aldolase family protein [Faecalibacillus sp.]
MYNFASDYLEGAHPSILEALNKTNSQQTPGYGMDDYCLQATQILKKQLKKENVDVHYLVGGTQTNMIVISSALRPYQAVITVDSGHINTHETGAVEFTGHKILTRPHQDGKITIDMIESILKDHPDEHMVQPQMVYISQTTEYGTYYTLEELKDIYQCCQKHDLYLFVDGARLGSALVLENAPSLEDLACYSDVFYIGGTKMGALFGECLVIVNDDLKKDFRYHIKQKGAMLAKGRLLGVQFSTLFSNDLYKEIGLHENECADILRKGFIDCGFKMYIDTVSNQLFPIVDKKTLAYLSKRYITTFMFDIDNQYTCIRLVTSWATSKQTCYEFVDYLQQMS